VRKEGVSERERERERERESFVILIYSNCPTGRTFLKGEGGKAILPGGGEFLKAARNFYLYWFGSRRWRGWVSAITFMHWKKELNKK
jgi:hypothetical protein